MQRSDWHGVFPAITTPFNPDGSVDHRFLAEHVNWLVDSGCRGIVPLGSLGEGNTLTFDEKVAILKTVVAALGGRAPVVAGIAGLSTQECVALARAAHAAGCEGLMVLPPYVYRGDWAEMKAHVTSVLRATPLPSMLYNNPIAYGTDFVDWQIEELADDHANLHAVKESSGDVRRVTATRALLGDRLAIFSGLDDMVVESIRMGASGWIAGLVNALPLETVRLVELARAGRDEEVKELYDWFLPLLRMDTVVKFVQLIKLVQAEVGKGSEAVRLPRLPLSGAEREEALAVVRQRLANRVPLLATQPA